MSSGSSLSCFGESRCVAFFCVRLLFPSVLRKVPPHRDGLDWTRYTVRAYVHGQRVFVEIVLTLVLAEILGVYGLMNTRMTSRGGCN
ncbi:hypothetical protein EDC04DRAFT_263692 [Pisolithus marmoratus]|nr:hypothetical protein EDC04DRAFT_263692 [Pisolithus marmoratus]